VVSVRRLVVLASVAMIGAAVALIPALAGAQSGSYGVTIINSPGYAFKDSNGTVPANLQVPAGATVSFTNPPAGPGPHDVYFTSGVPSACTGDPEVNSTTSSASAWSGSCTFTTPGTYNFICSVHGFSGTITVTGAGTTTTTSTTSPAPGPTGSGSTGATPPTSSNPSGTAASGLSLAGAQRGKAVRAQLTIGFSGSQLDARLLASAGAAKSHKSVVLGRLLRNGLAAGKLQFSVSLNRAGKRALRRRHRLSLTLRVTVTAPSGTKAALSRHVTLRG
jgi:plastocyanin